MNIPMYIERLPNLGEHEKNNLKSLNLILRFFSRYPTLTENVHFRRSAPEKIGISFHWPVVTRDTQFGSLYRWRKWTYLDIDNGDRNSLLQLGKEYQHQMNGIINPEEVAGWRLHVVYSYQKATEVHMKEEAYSQQTQKWSPIYGKKYL